MSEIEELQLQVVEQADARQDEVFIHLIEAEQTKLREVPSKFSTLEAYIDYTLSKYVHAKLVVHRLKKVLANDSGCGSSVTPDRGLPVGRLVEIASTPAPGFGRQGGWAWCHLRTLNPDGEIEKRLLKAQDELRDARNKYYMAVGRKVKNA